MDQKLVAAIAERIKAGLSEDEIKHEVISHGYDENSFAAAYAAALVNIASGPSVTFGEGVAPKSDDLLQIGRLFNVSWQMFLKNLSLLANAIFLFGGSLVVFGGISLYLVVTLAGDMKPAFLFVGAVLILVLVVVLITTTGFASLVRALLRRNEGEKFVDHLKWVLLNIIGIIVVSFYISLLTHIGYGLFIIPGLILNILLIFSTFYVIEGSQKGVSALVASTELVYGRFFKVLGRVLLSWVICGVVIFGTMLMASSSIFLPPILMSVVFLAMFLIIVASVFWQLCFTTALFETLKSTPVNETKPISTRALYLTYKTVIIIVFGVLVLGTFLLGFFANSLGGFKNYDTNWLETETVSDLTHKQTLRAAALDADFHKLEHGTYRHVCGYLTLLDDTVCESTETGFALETPLAWGYYCVDSTGYNEVNPRSVRQGSACVK